MIENIKELYAQIDYKTGFLIQLGESLQKSPLTLRNHWFGNFWSIPEEYHERVVTFMQNYIKQQNIKKEILQHGLK